MPKTDIDVQRPGRPPRREVPRRVAARLAALTRAIRNGGNAATERAALIASLRVEGFSYDAIATAAGVTREQVRKTHLRATSGYPADAA